MEAAEAAPAEVRRSRCSRQLRRAEEWSTVSEPRNAFWDLRNESYGGTWSQLTTKHTAFWAVTHGSNLHDS